MKSLNTLVKNFVIKFVAKIQSVTEINYLHTLDFKTRISNIEKIHEPVNITFSDSSKLKSFFQHSFSARYKIRLENAVVDPTNMCVFGIDKKDKLHLIKESTEWTFNRSLSISNSVTMETLEKDINISFPRDSYYHQIIEFLPRIINLKNANENLFVIHKDNRILNNGLIDFLNLPTITLKNPVKVKSVSLISTGSDLGYLHPSDLFLMKELMRSKNLVPNPHKMLYVSRRHSRRSDLDENMLETELIKNGFEIVFAENLSFLQQLNLFKDAKLVVGLHGAGLTNTIWTNKAQLIELMPDYRVNRCFEWIANLNQSNYSQILFSKKDIDMKTIFNQIFSSIQYK